MPRGALLRQGRRRGRPGPAGRLRRGARRLGAGPPALGCRTAGRHFPRERGEPARDRRACRARGGVGAGVRRRRHAEVVQGIARLRGPGHADGAAARRRSRTRRSPYARSASTRRLDEVSKASWLRRAPAALARSMALQQVPTLQANIEPSELVRAPSTGPRPAGTSRRRWATGAAVPGGPRDPREVVRRDAAGTRGGDYARIELERTTPSSSRRPPSRSGSAAGRPRRARSRLPSRS